MLPRVTYLLVGGLLIIVTTVSLLAQRWAVGVEERAHQLAADHAGRKLGTFSEKCSEDVGSLTDQRKSLREMLEQERKEKAQLQKDFNDLASGFGAPVPPGQAIAGSSEAELKSLREMLETERKEKAQLRKDFNERSLGTSGSGPQGEASAGSSLQGPQGEASAGFVAGSLQAQMLDTERKEKAQLQKDFDAMRANFTSQVDVWKKAQAEWTAWSTRYAEWAKTEADKTKQFCAIAEITSEPDPRFTPKASEIRNARGSRPYPTFEELYFLVVNEAYNPTANIWNKFPNPYGMKSSFVFPFSNLGDADVERAFQKLGKPPAFVVEVGSFHGNSAVRWAQALGKKGWDSVPLLCIDPWTGDLGELLFRDDWQKKLTPGEIQDGRSTSYFQFMLNMKNQIETGKMGPRHVIPLAITSNVGARYLQALALTPDIIYLDSAHEKDETFMEISLFYGVLAKGGVLMGDDYSWTSVSTDVDRFSAKMHLQVEMFGGSWMMKKPL